MTKYDVSVKYLNNTLSVIVLAGRGNGGAS